MRDVVAFIKIKSSHDQNGVTGAFSTTEGRPLSRRVTGCDKKAVHCTRNPSNTSWVPEICVVHSGAPGVSCQRYQTGVEGGMNRSMTAVLSLGSPWP
jgi:hypothetical protein